MTQIESFGCILRANLGGLTDGKQRAWSVVVLHEYGHFEVLVLHSFYAVYVVRHLALRISPESELDRSSKRCLHIRQMVFQADRCWTLVGRHLSCIVLSTCFMQTDTCRGCLVLCRTWAFGCVRSMMWARGGRLGKPFFGKLDGQI